MSNLATSDMQYLKDHLCSKYGLPVYLTCAGLTILCLHLYMASQGSTIKLLASSKAFTNGTEDIDLVNTPARCPNLYMPDSIVYNIHNKSLPQVSPYNANGTKNSSTVYTDPVLILTPVSDSKAYLEDYFKLLCSLTYPHHLISVALGEDSSSDDTFEYASYLSGKLQGYFRSIRVFHFSGDFQNIAHDRRHKKGWQLTRRAHLASSRNTLLFHALDDEKWVLWIDVDMKYFSPDIIQHLMSAGQPVVVPNCLNGPTQYGGYNIYDRNTWRETNASLRYLRRKPESYLQVEGYDPTKRVFLRQIQDEGLVVPIDGVGGCVLLIQADSHRRGLVYPPFVFDHHIETEGLAKMAAKMRIPICGLPFVNTVHA